MKLLRLSCVLSVLVWGAACDCRGTPPVGSDGGIDEDAGGGPLDAGTCGDRAINAGEDCDDGNATAGDGCDTSCHREASSSCGNSTVEYARFEECDDGNTASGDGCDAQCRREKAASCGDGTLNLAQGEQCDDTNTLPGDGCSSSCQFETVGAFCGDKQLDPQEKCDDGNTSNGDSCNPTCNFNNTTVLFLGTPGDAGFADGPASSAQLGGLGVLTADDKYLWLADGPNHVVRQINIASATVATIAGSADGGAAFVDDPNGVNARFGGIEAITTDGTTVWVADQGRVRAIGAAAPHPVSTVAGQGPGGTYSAGNGLNARFDDLRGLTYFAGRVYFVDANAGVLGAFDLSTGDVTTLAGTPYTTACPPQGTPTDGVGAAATFCSPRYMASDNSGMLYIADTNGNTIRSYNTVTRAVGTFAGTGSCGYLDGVGTAAAVHRPRGMTSDGTSLYWVEFNAHTLRQGVLSTQAVSTMLGTAPACTATCTCSPAPAGSYAEGRGAAAGLAFPFSVAYHFPSRSLFFVDSGNAVIRRSF
ncbi:MAG: DUF4215 domain-containing protein [Myxococcota bacterium]